MFDSKTSSTVLEMALVFKYLMVSFQAVVFAVLIFFAQMHSAQAVSYCGSPDSGPTGTIQSGASYTSGGATGVGNECSAGLPAQGGSLQIVPDGFALTAIGFSSDDSECMIGIMTAPVNPDGSVDFANRNESNFSFCPLGAPGLRTRLMVPYEGSGYHGILSGPGFPSYGGQKVPANHVVTGWIWGSTTSGRGAIPNECYYQEYMNLVTKAVSGWGSPYDGTCNEYGYTSGLGSMRYIVRAPAGSVIIGIDFTIDQDADLDSMHVATRLVSPAVPPPPPPDFQIDVSPGSLPVDQGNSVAFTVSVVPGSCKGSVTQVQLVSIPTDNGVSYSLSSGFLNCSGGGMSTSLIVTAAGPPSAAPPGPRSFIVRGQSQGEERTDSAQVVVDAIGPPADVQFVGESTDASGALISGTNISVQSGKPLILKWTVTNANLPTGCKAGGNWGGDKASSTGVVHSEPMGNMAAGNYTNTYSIQCFGPNGSSAIKYVTVNVNTSVSNTLFRVEVTPDNVRVVKGNTQGYTLTAYYKNSAGVEIFPGTNVTGNGTAIFQVDPPSPDVTIGQFPDAKNVARGINVNAAGVTIKGTYTEGPITRSDTTLIFVDPLSTTLSCPASPPPIDKGDPAVFTVNVSQNVSVSAAILTLPGLAAASGFGPFTPSSWSVVNIAVPPNTFTFSAGTAAVAVGSYRFRVSEIGGSGSVCSTDFTVGDEIDQITLDAFSPIVPAPGNPSTATSVVKVHYKSNAPGVMTPVPGSQVAFTQTNGGAATHLGSGTFSGLSAGRTQITATYSGLSTNRDLDVMDFAPQCVNCSFSAAPVDPPRTVTARLNRQAATAPYNIADVCFEIYVIDTTSGSTVLGGGNQCGGGPNPVIWKGDTWFKAANYPDVNYSLNTAALPANKTYKITINAYGSGLTRSSDAYFSIGAVSSYNVDKDPPLTSIMRDNGSGDGKNIKDQVFRVNNCLNIPAGQTMVFDPPNMAGITGVSAAFVGSNTTSCGGSVTIRYTANSSAGPTDLRNNPPQMPTSINVRSNNVAVLADKTIGSSMFIYGRPRVSAFAVTPATVNAGQSANITWDTEFVGFGNYCSASSSNGTWSGVKLQSMGAPGDSTGTLSTPGTYSYTIYCTGSGSFSSVQSTSVVVSLLVNAVAPPAPAITSTSTSCGGVTLNWTYSGSVTVNKFRIYRNSVMVKEIVVAATANFTGSALDNLSASGFYNYQMTAVSTANIESPLSNTMSRGWDPCQPDLGNSNKRVLEVAGVTNPFAILNPCDPFYTELDLVPREDQKIRFLINICNTGTADLDLSGGAANYLIIDDTQLTHLRKTGGSWDVKVQGSNCGNAPGWSSGAGIPQCQYQDNGSGLTIRLRNAGLPPGGNWQVSVLTEAFLAPNENCDTCFYANKAVITYPRIAMPPGSKTIFTGFRPFLSPTGEGVQLIEIPPGSN